jgi:hypothetical protein
MTLHLAQGFLLLLDKTAGNTTSAHLLLKYVPYAPLAGIVMIVAALMAMVELVYFHHIPNTKSVTLLLPQQVILIMAAGSAIEAIFQSHFADGVIRSRAFIVADQSVYILLAFFYTMAIIEVYMPEAIPWNFLRRI